MSVLRALREEMAAQGVDALIVGSEDRHQSEYVCDADMRRAFVSGFDGSSGTALVLKDQALLWTDGRYFLQAEQQLSAEWTLMKSGQKDVPDLNKWLLTNLTEGQVVGIDSWLVSATSAKEMKAKLEAKKITLKGVEQNPVDKVWADRPAAPAAPLIILPDSVTGVKHSEKIAELRKNMVASGAVGVLVTMLDETAWLLNLRGGDIAFNPVFFSYVVVTGDSVSLFIDPSKITPAVQEHLGAEVKVFGYDQVEQALSELAVTGKVVCDPSRASWRLHSLLGSSAFDEISSIQLAKSLKNNSELHGMRSCHIRDGVALTAFLHWLEKTVTATSPCTLTECQAVDRLEEFRGRMHGHVGPSFSTIAGYAANGAIIHYKPEPETCATLGTDSIFLLDSGAQYLDGTTDVTRTMHFGAPTQHMKECYTAVLKGHIGLAQIVIPDGCMGSRIDAVARLALWKNGLDYNHGTGHGVGAFLNVHEGPQGVGSRPRPNEAGFQSGMTISNEPGYYENGNFGIRIETIMVSRPVETKHCFNAKCYLGFETITMVPISTRLVDVGLLEDHELAWLNNYHAEVRAKLLPLMLESFPEAVDYLIAETQPVTRA